MVAHPATWYPSSVAHLARGTHRALVQCMATNTNTTKHPTNTNTKALTNGGAAAAQLPAPQGPAQSTVQGTTAANWAYPAQANTAKRPFTPKAGTTIAVLAAAVANGPAPIAQVQLALSALGLQGQHAVQTLARWCAKHRGMGYQCQGGLVSKL